MLSPRLISSIYVILIGVLLNLPIPALAGNFTISPLRIEFDRNTKNGAITITNSASTDLNTEIRLYEWTQSAAGNDIYTESTDLIFFPRMATIKPNEGRVVRVGLRGVPALGQEKSYRLYVEEIPDKRQSNSSAVGIAIRFGLPLFVKPIKEELRGEIEHIKMSNGQLQIKIHNNGNVHFKIESIIAKSEEGFSKEINGAYLLSGASRDYFIDVPKENCSKLKHINLTVKTDQMQIEGALDTTPAMCSGK